METQDQHGYFLFCRLFDRCRESDKLLTTLCAPINRYCAVNSHHHLIFTEYFVTSVLLPVAALLTLHFSHNIILDELSELSIQSDGNVAHQFLDCKGSMTRSCEVCKRFLPVVYNILNNLMQTDSASISNSLSAFQRHDKCLLLTCYCQLL